MEETNLILTDHLACRRKLLRGLYIISTNPADAQYSHLVIGCGADFVIIHDPTQEDMNAILRNIPQADHAKVCLFIDEFSDKDTRGAAMQYYRPGMFYLSGAQLASAIFSNVLPVLTGDPPRKRNAFSQRLNSQNTQSQMIAPLRRTIAPDTSRPDVLISSTNRPSISDVFSSTIPKSTILRPSLSPKAVESPSKASIPSSARGKGIVVKSPYRRECASVVESNEEDVDLSSPVTSPLPPPIVCTSEIIEGINGCDQHQIKPDPGILKDMDSATKPIGSVETNTRLGVNLESSDINLSANGKKRKNNSATEVVDGDAKRFKGPIKSSGNSSNENENGPVSPSASISLSSSSTGSHNHEEVHMAQCFLGKSIPKNQINGSKMKRNKNNDYIDDTNDIENSNDYDGIFFDDHNSRKRNETSPPDDDNFDDWVNAVQDIDREEILKCKRRTYKSEYGSAHTGDFPPCEVVTIRIEAEVIMRMLINKKNDYSSSFDQGARARPTRDVRCFRKNSIRIVDPGNVMSARYMEAVLPKVA